MPLGNTASDNTSRNRPSARAFPTTPKATQLGRYYGLWSDEPHSSRKGRRGFQCRPV